MIQKTVIARPPRVPPVLAELASKAREEPAAFLAGVIGRHATFEGAARELEVSLVTLRRWRERFGLEVE